MGNYVQEIRGGAGTIPIYRQPNFLDATECKGGDAALSCSRDCSPTIRQGKQNDTPPPGGEVEEDLELRVKDCPGWKRQGWREKIR
jgi:hypothetical protein